MFIANPPHIERIMPPQGEPGNGLDALYDIVLQWSLEFDHPLSKIGIRPTTSCRLLAMIGLEDLRSMVKDGSREGEQVNWTNVWQGGGVPTTLGEIAGGGEIASLLLEFLPAHRLGVVTRIWGSEILQRTNLCEWLKDLQQQILSGRHPDLSQIELSSLVGYAGYLPERLTKYRVAMAVARDLEVAQVADTDIRKNLVADLVDRREYWQHGSSYRCRLYNRSELVATLSS